VKVSACITVTRDDGTILIREIKTGTERVWVQANGTFQNENKAQLRRRLDRLVSAAINSTLGRS